MSHTLLFYDPGHFHAALTLRSDNPRVSPDVHVYASAGPDLERFVGLVGTFNRCESNPTEWRLHVHEGPDPMRRLIDERRGDVAILAGRNATKLAAIASLHEAGFYVLADKPWLTDPSALNYLEPMTAGDPRVMDIMTERFDVMARIRHRAVHTESVFGELDRDSEPAIEIESVHHLYKIVNGAPLRRPRWYYDVGIQGDGLVDIQSHMVDQVQWLVAPEHVFDYARDVVLERAHRWATPVPLELFRDSTGGEQFPDRLADAVSGDTLSLACNGEIVYSLLGVSVRQRAQWEPAGGGDLHRAVIRGTRASITLEHGPETGFVPSLAIEARPGIGRAELGPPLAAALEAWRSEFPGLELAPDRGGWRFEVPSTLHTSHESHFPMMLEQFLGYIDEGA